MEVKINQDVRKYTGNIFFGLSLRQCICSALAILISVGVYFLLQDRMGVETVSWICILCAAPFAAMGFITYHGMTAEQLLWAYIKSEWLAPKRLLFRPVNLYYELLKPSMSNREKQNKKGGIQNDKDTQQSHERGKTKV